jgi:hypothetical protein
MIKWGWLRGTYTMSAGESPTINFFVWHYNKVGQKGLQKFRKTCPTWLGPYVLMYSPPQFACMLAGPFNNPMR